jgi:histidine triad (HIT) family protein
MSKETIFSKIIRQEIATPLLYQDDLVSAFRDIAPRVDSHILIVPNKLITTINEVSEEDELTLGRMITVAKKIS